MKRPGPPNLIRDQFDRRVRLKNDGPSKIRHDVRRYRVIGHLHLQFDDHQCSSLLRDCGAFRNIVAVLRERLDR